MIFIRADLNETIGTGHVMRCLSIARAFTEMGESVKFITADHKGDGIIASQGFENQCLESDWANMESELDSLEKLIEESDPLLLLVDSYYVTPLYLKELSSMIRIAYIDDLNKEKWSVDFLINYNIFSDEFDYSWYNNSITRTILHPQYAPIRDEFKNAPRHKIKKVTDVLVSAGGSV